MEAINASYEAVVGAVHEMTRDCPADLSGYDKLIVAITACILEGIDTRDGIIRTVPPITGESHAYVAKILDRLTGMQLDGSEWAKGADGRYRLLVD